MVGLLALVIAAPAFAQSNPPAKNRTPVVTTSLADPPVVTAGDVLRLSITVSGPDGDKVSARLIQAPPLVGFLPLVDAASPATRETAWYPAEWEGGRHELVVETW